ncbi:hypothetical protein AZZ95_001254, partial [Enterobacter roggenkampii]
MSRTDNSAATPAKTDTAPAP